MNIPLYIFGCVSKDLIEYFHSRYFSPATGFISLTIVNFWPIERSCWITLHIHLMGYSVYWDLSLTCWAGPVILGECLVEWVPTYRHWIGPSCSIFGMFLNTHSAIGPLVYFLVLDCNPRKDWGFPSDWYILSLLTGPVESHRGSSWYI